MPEEKRVRPPAQEQPLKRPVLSLKTPQAALQTAEWFGSMKGTFEILGDIVSPANDESDWEVLRD